MTTKRIKITVLVDTFNARCPIGSAVDVTLDDGTVRRTKTRSLAWCVGGHSPIVNVEGISGGYLLDRVRIVECDIPVPQEIIAVTQGKVVQP